MFERRQAPLDLCKPLVDTASDELCLHDFVRQGSGNGLEPRIDSLETVVYSFELFANAGKILVRFGSEFTEFTPESGKLLVSLGCEFPEFVPKLPQHTKGMVFW